MALDIRFFQGQAIPPTSAVSITLVDNFASFTVQIFIILAALVFGFGQIDLDLRASGHRVGQLLLVLVILIGLTFGLAIIAIAVPRLRHRALDRLRPHLDGVRETVVALRSRTRVAHLLLSNLGAEVLPASTLGVVVVSLGSSLSLATLLVIDVGVTFFAGLIPVPGGIGVTEGALVVGLTAAGLDQAIAFAAAICYRLCTYYLPPVIGWFAMRRLEKTGLL
jgi:glycosyltransferase 2 family protein